MRNLSAIDENKDIVTKEYVDALKPVSLWSGSSSSGNIVLNDSVANYSFIEVYYQNRGGYTSCSKIYSPQNKIMALQTGNGETLDGYYLFNTCVLSFSGTTVSRSQDRYINIHTNAYPTVGTNVSYYTLTIIEIIGYK